MGSRWGIQSKFFIIPVIASILILGTTASATLPLLQCDNVPPSGNNPGNKGKPFLEIWAAICMIEEAIEALQQKDMDLMDEDTRLQGEIDNISLTPGPQGDKGDTGATGTDGAKGDKGDTGAAGTDGAKGDKGDTGAAGTGGTGVSCKNQNIIKIHIPAFVLDPNCTVTDLKITNVLTSNTNTAVVFTVTVENIGNGIAKNVVIVDVKQIPSIAFPGGTDSFSVDTGSCTPFTFFGFGVNCSVGDMAPGAKVVLTYTRTHIGCNIVSPTFGDTIQNSASVSTDTSETTLVNNLASLQLDTCIP